MNVPGAFQGPVNSSENNIDLSYFTQFESHEMRQFEHHRKIKQLLQKIISDVPSQLFYLANSNLRSHAVLTKVPRKIFTKINSVVLILDDNKIFNKKVEGTFTNPTFAPDNTC